MVVPPGEKNVKTLGMGRTGSRQDKRYFLRIHMMGGAPTIKIGCKSEEKRWWK